MHILTAYEMKGSTGKRQTHVFLCNDDNSYYVFYIKMILSVLFTPVCDDSEDNKKDRKLEKIFTSSSLLLSFFFNQLKLLRHNFEGAALVKM